MSLIRPFTTADIPQVAALFQKVFLAGGAPATNPATQLQHIAAAFEELFFRNPWYDERLPSLVCETADGKLLGFLGITPRNMLLGNRPIQAAVSVHHMVEPGLASGLVGVQLLKKFFGGPQDLCYTDGANPLGRRIWMGIGGKAAHLQSFNWVKPLRPSTHVLARAALKFPGISSLSFATQPLCELSDSVLARMMPYRFRFAPPDPAELRATELDEETLLHCISHFSAAYALRPAYDSVSLHWVIHRIGNYQSLGKLQGVALRNDRNEIAGWYLYYLNPGGESEVVQLHARTDAIGPVLDHLFHHAWENGAVIITGKLSPLTMQSLSDKGCAFNCEPHWTLMHSRDPEILNAIARGDAFLSKLEGELSTSYQS